MSEEKLKFMDMLSTMRVIDDDDRVRKFEDCVEKTFQDVFKRFATLRMVGKSEITSNPIFTEDGQTSGYTCRYRLEDGCDGEENFPSGFNVKCQFAKAGDFYYEFGLDLLFSRDDDNELMIEVLCPVFENIEEEAIIDESNYIKEQTANLTELLVLSDF